MHVAQNLPERSLEPLQQLVRKLAARNAHSHQFKKLTRASAGVSVMKTILEEDELLLQPSPVLEPSMKVTYANDQQTKCNKVNRFVKNMKSVFKRSD